MNTLITLAEAWWPLYAVHMIEVSLFILLVWAVDRWLTLETRLRYALYLLALAKVLVPPVFAIPIPEFLVFSTNVTVDAPVYSGVVSEAIAVSPAQVPTLPPAFYLFCLWTLSVLVWAGVAVWKNAAFRRTLKSAAPVVDLAPKIASLNAPGNLNVFSKPTLPSPILVGLVRPRLYLPSKWSSWSPDELRGVVKHELAHFERRDIFVLILQAVATALFCANPLIWLLNRRLMYIRELRCDEAVLRETNLTPAEYGRLLLGFVDRRPAPSALTLYLIEREPTLKARFEHLLNYKEGEMKRSKWQLVIVLIVGLMVVPFSIREAYTQNEHSPGMLSPADGGIGTELIQGHQTATPATSNVDPHTGGFPTFDENEVETKPVPIRQAKRIVIGDIIAQIVNSDTAPEAGFTAAVTLKVRVDVDGSVDSVKILSAEGPVVFKNAAIDAVSRMRFKPAKLDGEIVPGWFTERISVRSSKSKAAAPASGHVDSNDILPIVYDTKEVDVKPHPVQIFGPDYPEEALNSKIDGEVHLKFIVNVDSSVSDVTVLKGPEIFHNAATDAALQWRFRPAMHRGKVVPAWMIMPIGFSLRPEGEAPSLDSVDAGRERAFELGAVVDAEPVIIHSIPPIYPDNAQEPGLEVNVFLKFKVNVHGIVSDVRVLKVSVHGPVSNGGPRGNAFRQPAIDAISQYRFKPAEHEGRPVPVWMTHRIKFQLPKQKAVPSPDKSDIGGDKVFEFWSVDEKPVLTHSVPPIYPDLALRAGLKGNVFLRLKVNADGTVSDIKVLKGQAIFRKPATDALSQFRFKPAELGGKPVPVWMAQRLVFRPPARQVAPTPDSGDTGIGD